MCVKIHLLPVKHRKFSEKMTHCNVNNINVDNDIISQTFRTSVRFLKRNNDDNKTVNGTQQQQEYTALCSLYTVPLSDTRVRFQPQQQLQRIKESISATQWMDEIICVAATQKPRLPRTSKRLPQRHLRYHISNAQNIPVKTKQSIIFVEFVQKSLCIFVLFEQVLDKIQCFIAPHWNSGPCFQVPNSGEAQS